MLASLHTRSSMQLRTSQWPGRRSKDLVENKLVLGNDITSATSASIGCADTMSLKGQFECYGPGKNGPFDIRLKNGECVSVKTTSEWNESGYGSRVCADGEDWTILAAVFLDKNLYPESWQSCRFTGSSNRKYFQKMRRVERAQTSQLRHIRVSSGGRG